MCKLFYEFTYILYILPVTKKILYFSDNQMTELKALKSRRNRMQKNHNNHRNLQLILDYQHQVVLKILRVVFLQI